jgi:hypothetical protein
VDFKYGSMRGGWCSKEVGGSFGFGVLLGLEFGRVLGGDGMLLQLM